MENRGRYAYVLLALVAFAQSNPAEITVPSITVTPPVSSSTQSSDANAVSESNKTPATNVSVRKNI